MKANQLPDVKSSTHTITAVIAAAASNTLPVGTAVSSLSPSSIHIEAAESNQKQPLITASPATLLIVNEWQTEFFPDTKVAIEEVDEEKLSVLLGPDLYSLENMYYEKNLFNKYHENTSQLIELFYQYVISLIPIIQNRLKTDAIIALYEKEKVSVSKEEIAKFKKRKTSAEKNHLSPKNSIALLSQYEEMLAKLDEKKNKDAEDGKKIVHLRQLIKGMRADIRAREESNIKCLEEKFEKPLKEAEKAVEEFERIKNDYYQRLNDSKSQDIIVTGSSLTETIREPLQKYEDAPEVRDKAPATLKKLVLTRHSELYTHIKKSIEAESERIVAILMNHLTNEIEILRQERNLSTDSIKRRYIEPVSQVYTAKLNDLIIFFEEMLLKHGAYLDLEKIPALLNQQKQTIQKKLNAKETSKNPTTTSVAIADQVPSRMADKKEMNKDEKQTTNLEKEKAILIDNYRKQAIQWLTHNKDKLKVKVNDPAAFVDRIIQSHIGSTRLDLVKDASGNTLMHIAMKRYSKAKFNSDFRDPQREQSLNRIIEKLESRGASVFVGNYANQTAEEYAMDIKGTATDKPKEKVRKQSGNTMIDAEREISAKEAQYHKVLDWPSMINIIHSIRTYTPLTNALKTKMLAYSLSNDKKLKDWSIIDNILFNRMITERDRLNEVAVIAKFLQMAGHEKSDTLVEDAIRQLSKQANSGLLRRSDLFSGLFEIIENPDLWALRHSVETLKEFDQLDRIERAEAEAKQAILATKSLEIKLNENEKKRAAEMKELKEMLNGQQYNGVSQTARKKQISKGRQPSSYLKPRRGNNKVRLRNATQANGQINRATFFASTAISHATIDNTSISTNTNSAGSTAAVAPSSSSIPSMTLNNSSNPN